ncbi:hypothetical protein [Roseicyclus sp.]|jgi:hypothetical protein
MKRLTLATAATLLAAQTAAADTARFQFCWIGANGYTMEGMIEFPETLLDTDIISERQVTGFRIQGYKDGVPVGFWSLDMATPETSWTLSFDTRSLRFPTGGSRSQQTYQEWNANGEVNNCGADGGFGFNGGNWAQDVCINNRWVEESSIDPFTPLRAFPMDVRLTCDPVVPVS